MKHWTIARQDDGLAQLTLDRAGASANTLSGAPSTWPCQTLFACASSLATGSSW